MADPRGIPASELDPAMANNSAGNADDALLQSLNQLSISTSPSPARRSASRTPSRASSHSPRVPAHTLSSIDRLTLGSPGPRNSPRSPVSRTVSNGNGNGPPSRSGTPTLLRKASTNSLHSNSGVTPSRPLSRRSSAANLMSPTIGKSPLNGGSHIIQEEERPKLTPASVASAYFESEMLSLHGPESTKATDTLVIFHDSCYGHRFSRTKTTKANLLTIVERPERIQACAVGVALAYVRLGDRHCEGKVAIHPKLDPNSLGSIPFRIQKTDRKLPLTSPAVTNVHGSKWMEDLKKMCSLAESNLAWGLNELERPQSEPGAEAQTQGPLHVGDLYLCGQSLAAFEGALGAVCEAVDAVFSPSPIKRAFVAVRPPGHHCTASQPQGFCWLNNVHVGIMHGFLNHGLTHAAIIDFDLHHGDGSQAITWAHNQRGAKQPKNAAAWKRTSIGYFSLHDINSYPCELGDEDNVKAASLCIENAHGQNIWNVHLQEWSSEVEFWTLYQTTYSLLLEKTRMYLRRQAEKLKAAGQVPKAAIFLSAGFDASEWEGTGMQRHVVNVPTEFYARLTRDVIKLASEEGLAVEGRVISALEGGYSDRALASGVFSHLSGLAGNEAVSGKDETINGLGREMGQRISSLTRRNTMSSDPEGKSKAPGFPYDPAWWSKPELDRLDAAMGPPPAEPRQPRNITPPTYSSPTQASNAKVNVPARFRRSVSGLSSLGNGSQPIITRAPSPPPPEVPWTSAVHELSKLLVPTDRPISSITWDEIKADANRAKRERQSLPAQHAAMDDTDGVSAPVRKSLRERKPVKAPSPVEPEDLNHNRRKTVAGSSVLATEKASARGISSQTTSKHTGIPSRRLSGASVITTSTPDPAELSGSAPRSATATFRPETSQSMRPETAISIQTQAPMGLPMKKIRPVAPARKDSAKATPRAKKTTKTIALKVEPKKTSGVSSKSASPTRSQGRGVEIRPSRDTSMAPSTGHSDSGSEVSRITNGVRKIKLVTKEMKEAREKKEQAETQSRPESRAVEEPAGITQLPALAPSVGMHIPTPDYVKDTPSSSVSPETLPRLPVVVDASHIGDSSLAADPKLSSPVRDTPMASSPIPNSPPLHPASQTDADDLFLQYQPAGPAPSSLPPSGPLQWLPSNVAETPQQFKRGHNFTATSPIPFATGRPFQETRVAQKEKAALEQPQGTLLNNQAPLKTEEMDEGLWKVPKTPQHQ